jgi:hypothetical protein
MSTIQDVSAEQLAKVFYRYHEVLSQEASGHSNPEKSCSWDRVSQNQRKLMLAAARLALLELSTMPVESKATRKYYAEPGEAEWGC